MGSGAGNGIGVETRLRLHPRAVWVDPADMDADLRSRLVPEAEAVDPRLRILTRSDRRGVSVALDGNTVELLQLFSEPRTVVDAVLELAGRHALDPESLLATALPVAERCYRKGFLHDADPENEGEEADTGPPVRVGQLLDLGTGVESIFEVSKRLRKDRDTAVFLLRGPGPADFGSEPRSESASAAAVLKIYRVDDPGVGSLSHEGTVLRQLGARRAESASAAAPRVPQVLASGELEGWPYLLLEWLPGISTRQAGAEARRIGRRRALDLGRSILGSYVALHDAGWLHGDVHPGNIRVDGAWRPSLLDLALARPRRASATRGRRPVAPHYMEPEHARSILAGEGPRLPSEAGEQFVLASVLYEILAGSQYHPFSLAREALLREVAESRPRSFEALGEEPWPEVEAVLGRALELKPEDRYPSLADFASALDAVDATPTERPVSSVSTGFLAISEPRTQLGRVANEVRERIGLGGGLWRDGEPGDDGGAVLPGTSDGRTLPTASLKLGAAGIGYACWRMAAQLQDGEMQALAELWTARATGLLGRDAAFYPGSPWGREELGTAGPFHARLGVMAVEAGLAAAADDPKARHRAMKRFLDSGEAAGRLPLAEGIGRDGPDDLTLGTAGALMVAAHLRPMEPAGPILDRLDAWASALASAFEVAMAEADGPADPATLLGMAHGWGGQLYALLQWYSAIGSRPGEGVIRRLRELADLAEPHGRGVHWPWVRTGRRRFMAGWCNGGSGLVFLWSSAAKLLGEPGAPAAEWLELAERTAWGVMDSNSKSDNLCCGTLGHAYAALHLHRLSTEFGLGGSEDWLVRARHLGEKAADRRQFGRYPLQSLYRGELGLAVLEADLERPLQAIFPFFEPWARADPG